MAKQNFTLNEASIQNQSERISAAREFFNRLRAAKSEIDGFGPRMPNDVWFARIDSNIDALMVVAGPMSQRAEGTLRAAVGLLMEELLFGHDASCLLDSDFVPEAAMTRAEIEKVRAEFAREVDEMRNEPATA